MIDQTGKYAPIPSSWFFGSGVNRPEPAQADWLFASMRAAGHVAAESRDAVRVRLRPTSDQVRRPVAHYSFIRFIAPSLIRLNNLALAHV